MRRLVDIRLPERLPQGVPRWITEAAVGIGVALLFLALRIAIAPLTGQAAPYALSFVAVVVACLLAGWRAGLVALVLGQALVWVFVVPPTGLLAGEHPAAFWALILASASELAILGVLALYQHEVRAAQAEREKKIDFLGHALREIDHRTHNNFQTVLALLLLQSRQAADPAVQEALKEAADRVQAVSLAYAKLALSSEGLEEVRLHDHLQELCDQLGRGLLPEGVRLEADLAPVTVAYEKAVCLGIIVNELVTNAVKHAFPDGRGTIRISAAVRRGRLGIEVTDDGTGMGEAGPAGNGLGTRLITAFVKRLGAHHDVKSGPEGTRHRIAASIV